MSVLRKIGRFVGNAVRKVGNIAGAVLKPLNALAAPLKPLMAMTPMGKAVGMGLEVATGVTDIASRGGKALVEATGGG
jgi:hypothetical protein